MTASPEIDYAALEAAANESVHWTGVGKNDLLALIAKAKERDEFKEIHLTFRDDLVAAHAEIANLRSLLAKAGEALERFSATERDIDAFSYGERASKFSLLDDVCVGQLRAARSVRDEIKDALPPIAALQKEGT